MSDDLDDLLRRTMKTLDDQVPSGYFEALPNRTLARLEDSSMQTTGTSDSGSNINAGVPPQDRDEDSGLHDIRSMASSAKLRISSRRISTSPPFEDDILASSSAGWKAVALPEPAKMVSLPSIDQLPTAKEIKAQEKADRQSAKQLKAERTSAKEIAKAAIAVETSAPIAAKAAVVEPPVASVTPIIGARFAKAQPKSRTGLYAIVGLGLAAAAGGAFYVTTMNKKSETAPAVNESVAAQPAVAAEPPAAAPTGTASAAVAAPDPTTLAIATDTTTDTAEAAANSAKADAEENDSADRKRAKKPTKGRGEASKDEAKPESKDPKPEVKSEVKKPGGGDNEPSFDDLLKEAGVQDKKPAKVILDKKSLSGSDIKKGMGGISAKAQGCYAGTQGTAKVKLTVAPSGAVQKVTVTGVFAGTPVGACVESAVKGASFPPWDGGPQTFGYSYLLAE